MSEVPEQEARTAAARPAAIVGIGASAGGLEPLKRFFAAIPAATGISYIVIQHFAPDHHSMLAEILARHTALPVCDIQDGCTVLPDTVYVLSSPHDLHLDDCRLRLSPPAIERLHRRPIDTFFRSLAQAQRENAVGIVLSGTGSDGTQGCRDLKASGSMVMIQHPDEATHAAMPRSVMLTGLADYVLPVAELPAALVRYVQHNELFADHADHSASTSQQLDEVIHLLRVQAAHDFRQYKPNTLWRRIQRRMGLQGVGSLDDYLHLLRSCPDEAQALANDLLICITAFFRNPDAWAVLRDDVLTKLIATKPPQTTLRVWVAGCATGEEAYSMAMLLTELLEQGHDLKLQIFATDLSTHALKTARAAVYPLSIAADVGPARLQRFFVPHDEQNYRLIKSVRDKVIFAAQDLMGDPPFSRLDLISCRNLLIYLEPAAQRQILTRFHFSLNEHGYLFLGSSETPARLEEGFTAVAEKRCIYRKIPTSSVVGLEPLTPKLYPLPPPPVTLSARKKTPDYRELAAELTLKHSAAAVLLLNERWQPLYVSGNAERFLTIPSGEQRYSVLDMARPGLHLKLRAALQRAVQERGLVEFHKVRVRQPDGSSIMLNGLVEPVRRTGDESPLLFVRLSTELPDSLTPADSGAATVHDNAEELVRQLEYELLESREELSSTIEQLEQTNEELRAANEEALSINEELQSGTEELEASKEELQSLNEELTTLNAQLEDKLRELEATNNDLDNLLSSTRIAVLFLDTQLHVRNFTPEAVALFRLIRTDIGRPIGDLKHAFADTDTLLNEARQVLETLTPTQQEVCAADGGWYLRRLLPYRTRDNRIEGVVVTFHDITSLKHTQQQLEDRESRLRLLTDALPVLISYVDREEKYQYVNANYQTWFGLSSEAIIGHSVREIVGDEVYALAQAQIRAALAGQRLSWERELPYRYGGKRYVSVEYVPHYRADGTVLGYYALIQDIAARKQIEVELQTARAAAEERAQELLEIADRFRTLADNIDPFAWMADGTGWIFWYNQRWFDYAGTTLAESQGWNWRKFHHPDHVGRVMAKISHCFRTGKIWEDTFPLRAKDGSYRWFLSRAVPIRDAKGQVLRWFGSNTDITERMRMEEALRQADQRKDEFLATLSHELRNPLAPIRTGLQLLQLAGDDRATAEKVRAMMERQTRHLIRLVDDLLDVSRITRGKVTLQKNRVALAEVLQNAIETVQPFISDCGHTLHVTLPTEPVFLYADATRLAQVFSNLLHNAANYSEKGGQIWLNVTVQAQQALVAVKDAGIGISAAMLSHVFDLFAQEDRSLERPQRGLGIGLTLVKSLVDLHEGQVQAYSQGRGLGSEFVVRLPLAPAEPAAAVTERRRSAQAAAGKRILVVDDNEDAAQSIGLLLESLGHEVRLAYDGEQALAAAAEYQPQVVLLDLGMPRLNGYDTARRLRQESWGRDVLLVALTGWGQDRDRQRTQAAGFDHHLVKPVELAAVQALLDNPIAAK